MKKLIYNILYFLQWHRLIRFFSNRKVILLTYHGFTDKGTHKGIENHQGKHLHTEKFEAQVRYLKKYYNVISLERVVEFYTKGKTLPDRSVVITMDDGYKSNYTLAFPILKQYEVPASIFLTTAFVDQQELLWPDRVEYAINRASVYPLDSKETIEDKIRSELKTVPQELRSEIIEGLERQLGQKLSADDEPPEMYRPLDWEDVSEMVQTGLIAIGSHTHTHVILTKCNNKSMREELLLSKEIIEKKTGFNCSLFCYPNGGTGDFDERTKSLLKELGYSCGLTTVAGFNGARSDVFELKRFGVRNQMDFIEFVMTLCGVKFFLSNMKQLLGQLFHVKKQ